MAACDTVFLFDLPVGICLEGAISRQGKERYDLPWCDTELDPKFRQEIVAFPEKNLPGIYALIDKYRDGRDVLIFHSRAEADSLLETISSDMKTEDGYV